MHVNKNRPAMTGLFFIASVKTRNEIVRSAYATIVINTYWYI